MRGINTLQMTCQSIGRFHHGQKSRIARIACGLELSKSLHVKNRNPSCPFPEFGGNGSRRLHWQIKAHFLAEKPDHEDRNIFRAAKQIRGLANLEAGPGRSRRKALAKSGEEVDPVRDVIVEVLFGCHGSALRWWMSSSEYSTREFNKKKERSTIKNPNQ